MENWLPIEDFPAYEVSDEGRVRNASTQRILKQTQDPRTGILWVALRKNLHQYSRGVHRLVAHAFLFPAPDNCVPIHLDGNRRNNHAENLDWKTLSQARDLTSERHRTKPLDPRPVRIIGTAEVFENALAAARETGGREKYILLAAQNGSSMHYRGKYWEFA